MKYFPIFFLVIFSTETFSQVNNDTTYQFEFSATISPVISFFRNERFPGSEKEAKFGFASYIRGVWHPGRLLSFGIMTGYCSLAADKIHVRSNPSQTSSFDARASLVAVPLQVIVTMQKWNLEVGVGMGPYMLLSNLNDGEGNTATGRRFELGLTFVGNYLFPLSENIYWGPELKILYLSYRGILSFMPTVNFRIKSFRY